MFFLKKKNSAVVATATKGSATDLSPTLSDLDTFGHQRKKVLLIEDDPVVVKMLSFALGKGGYRVLTTDDAGQAICLMRDEKPDMLLVDVTLPPDIGSGAAQLADGFQLTRWLHYSTGRKTRLLLSAARIDLITNEGQRMPVRPNSWPNRWIIRFCSLPSLRPSTNRSRWAPVLRA